jgi:hypothetical protein
VVHRPHETPRTAFALLATLALPTAEDTVARLMRVLVAIHRGAVAVAEPTCAGLVTRILRPALTIPVAKLFLPALGGWSGSGLLSPTVLLWSALKTLRLAASESCALAVGLHICHKLAASTLCALLAWVNRFVLPLAAPPATALGLPHAVRNTVPGLLRRTHIAVAATHLAIHLCGLRQRTLMRLHLGYILL